MLSSSYFAGGLSSTLPFPPFSPFIRPQSDFQSSTQQFMISVFWKLRESKSTYKYSSLDLHRVIVPPVLSSPPFPSRSTGMHLCAVSLNNNRFALVSLDHVCTTVVIQKRDPIHVPSEVRTCAPLMHAIISRDAATFRFHHGRKRSP